MLRERQFAVFEDVDEYESKEEFIESLAKKIDKMESDRYIAAEEMNKAEKEFLRKRDIYSYLVEQESDLRKLYYFIAGKEYQGW
jgi:hypothetical protein